MIRSFFYSLAVYVIVFSVFSITTHAAAPINCVGGYWSCEPALKICKYICPGSPTSSAPYATGTVETSPPQGYTTTSSSVDLGGNDTGGCSNETRASHQGTDLEGAFDAACDEDGMGLVPHSMVDQELQKASDKYFEAQSSIDSVQTELETSTAESITDLTPDQLDTMVKDLGAGGLEENSVGGQGSLDGTAAGVPAYDGSSDTSSSGGPIFILPPRIDPVDPCTWPGGYQGVNAGLTFDCSIYTNDPANDNDRYDICVAGKAGAIGANVPNATCAGPVPAPLTCAEIQLYNVAYCAGDNCGVDGTGEQLYVQFDTLNPPACGCDNPTTGCDECYDPGDVCGGGFIQNFCDPTCGCDNPLTVANECGGGVLPVDCDWNVPNVQMLCVPGGCFDAINNGDGTYSKGVAQICL